MPATHAQETDTRQFGTSFFWYQFLVQNRTQIYSITETVQHVTDTNRAT